MYNVANSPVEGDELMIEHIEVENFRGFRKVLLKELKRVNIIVGRNASGKTALLESIYLTSGGPALSFKLKTWRGMGERFEFPLDERELGGIWKDLFYMFESNSPARIALRGSSDVTRTLEIKTSPSEVVFRPGQLNESLAPISFQWFKGRHPMSNPIRPVIEGNQLKFQGAPEAIKAALYASSAPVNAQESARWFSELSKTRNADTIVQVIKQIFPFIADLSVEIQSNMSMVHADIPALPERIPLGLVSTGINKLFAILVAMPHEKVVLVDEIENGMYFDTLPQIWTAIYDYASKCGSQIFASTHSWECLKAAAEVVKHHPDDFRIIKLKRENGNCSARIIVGRDFESAMEEDVEVR